ncbi:TlpA family protein disulfide reductase [Paenibacillus paeoniae]|uniref:TlpA family protein disulfide reductase n=1 Tax=Paenibacillus paeoniae TaxID=2292705 RepID=A0A371P7C7_9BACL|nr:TlpA disulfide reductase family protein [Paenibacillus paeoniae]REK71822.1 TlpA family protein disulfide reductase [Paenibacillus paeoniae]
MTNIQLGSLVLNTELLVYMAAGMIGILALRVGGKGMHKEELEKDVSVAWSAVFIWIAVWKGSLLLVDPMSVVRQPMSLLFFSGGRLGFWLAVVAVLLWFGYKYKRHGFSGAGARIALLMSGWTLIYALSVLIFDRGSFHYGHSMGLLLSLCGLLLLRRLDRMDRWRQSWAEDSQLAKRMLTQGIVALVVIGLLSFTLQDQAQSGFIAKLIDGSEADETVGAREGQKAPAFELVNLAGEELSLEGQKGSVVIVNFWTTWCKVCKTEMPHVQKLYEYYAAQGDAVKLVSVNVTSQEASAVGVERYMEDYGYSFPLALDMKGEAAYQYRVKAYPATFIIDSDGVIRERMLGAISFSDMKKRIDRVLAAE